jgi:hypothetical protein
MMHWIGQNRGLTVLLVSLALLSVASVGLMVFIFSAPRFPPPVYTYGAARLQAQPSTLCPGETFTYAVDIHVNTAPVTVAIVETVWDEELGRTVVFDDSPKWAAYTRPDTIQRNFSYVVPPLPPGRYALHSVAAELGAAGSGFSVPFSVKAGCDG